jgi:hypothetical protein
MQAVLLFPQHGREQLDQGLPQDRAALIVPGPVPADPHADITAQSRLAPLLLPRCARLDPAQRRCGCVFALLCHLICHLMCHEQNLMPYGLVSILDCVVNLAQSITIVTNLLVTLRACHIRRRIPLKSSDRAPLQSVET